MQIKYYQDHLEGGCRGARPIPDWIQPAPPPAVHQVDRLIRSSADEGHDHVAGVVATPATGDRAWQLRDFVDAIRRGERFFVRESGYVLELEPTLCDRCGCLTISTLTKPRKG